MHTVLHPRAISSLTEEYRALEFCQVIRSTYMIMFATEWHWHTCHLLVKGTLGQESRHVCAFQYMIMMQDDVYTL